MKMKKLGMLAISLVLTLLLVACGGSTRTPISKETPSAENPAQSSASQRPKEETTIDEFVILNQDGFIITVKELVEDSLWGTGVKFLIENETEQNLGFSCESVSVNNYMIPDLFSSSVAAGMKSNDILYFASSLDKAGIEILSDISLSFRVYDGDTYQTIFVSDSLEIRTSAYGSVIQPALDEGDELYNENGVRIVGRYIEDDPLFGANVSLFIENDREEPVIVQCDNVSVNGFMVTALLSQQVTAGRMALSDITILSSDLETNDIETIDTVSLVFKVLNVDTYQTIAQSEPVTFYTN